MIESPGREKGYEGVFSLSSRRLQGPLSESGIPPVSLFEEMYRDPVEFLRIPAAAGVLQEMGNVSPGPC